MSENAALSAPFLRLYVLTLLFFSANAMLTVIVPLRSESFGASNGDIGVIMGAYMFTCMFVRPWAGHLIQKHGPVVVLRSLLIVNGAALLLYTLDGLDWYLTARVMQGVCTAFFSMALQTGIIDALPEERRSQGLSLYSLFTYMPTVLGPLIAVGIWDWGGVDAFTAVMIGIALITALFGYSVPMRAIGMHAHDDADGERPNVSLRGALAGLRDRKPFLACSALMLVASIVFGSVTTFIPLYAKQISFGHAGVFLMIQASIIVFSRFAFSKRIPSDGKWHARFVGAVCCLMAAGSMLLCLSGKWGPIAFYAAAVLIGIAQALLYPTLVSYLTFILPGQSRNVWLGFFIAAADLGVSLGGIALGPVADSFSYAAMYAATAGLAVIALWIAIANRDRQCGP